MTATQMETKGTSDRPSLRPREERVDPMWSADEDDRRLAIAARAAAGARRAWPRKRSSPFCWLVGAPGYRAEAAMVLS